MTTPITTTTQLEALPINSVILDDDGVAWQRLEANWWKSTDGTGTGGVQGIFSPPWTLLHVPGQAPTVKPGRDEVYAIVRDLVRDKGNVVYEWPDDEAAAYRDHDGFSEGMQAVEDLRAEKGTLAVLAILPGKSVAQVRAGALRDAAIALYADETAERGTTKALHHSIYAAWLIDRADEEAGK